MPDPDSVLIASEGGVTVTGRVSPIGVASRGMLGGEEEGPTGGGLNIFDARATVERELLLADALFEGGDMALTTSGDLAEIAGLDNLRDALGRRVITRPGQIVFRPSYGIGLVDFVSLPGTLANKQEIDARMKRNLLDDSRVEQIIQVSVRQDGPLVEVGAVVKALGVKAEFVFVASRVS